MKAATQIQPRTILVTGGGSGIGKAVATLFAADGDRVFITGRRKDLLEAATEEIPGDVTAVVCDHTDPDQLIALAAQLPPGLDVLVNNAGGNRDMEGPPPAGLHELAARWRANLEANLLAAVLTTAVVDDRLGPGSAVVNIGSFAADRGAGSYGAAKAGMNTWNIFLAKQLGARGITCNVVAPGYIDETEFFHGRKTPEFHAERVAETLIQRAGKPADIAEAVRFLASPAARHITCQVLRVDGGVVHSR
jgi:3-oxoacyl-[acyl-carrier protein] reductase